MQHEYIFPSSYNIYGYSSRTVVSKVIIKARNYVVIIAIMIFN